MKRKAAVTLKYNFKEKKKPETKFFVKFSGKYQSQIKTIC